MVEVYSTRLRAPGAGPVVEARAPDVQSGFNAVAGALSDAAQTLRRADQASQLTDARRTVLEGYAAAEADLEKDQDWLGMEGRQNERLIKIREEALGKIGYESLRDDFALDLDRQGFAHIGNVRRRAFGLQKDHTLASLDETLNLYRERAAKLDDPMALNALLDDAGAAVSDVREGGFIDELQARRLADGLETGVFGDFTARLVERDPQGALRVLETPGALPIDEQTRLTALTRAQGEIDRRRAKAEAAAAKRELSAERALAAFNEGAFVGLSLTPEREAELMAEVAPAGPAYARRAEAAIRRTGLYQRLALMTPAARAAELEGWRRSGGASSDDVDWFGKLQALDGQLADAEERDRTAVAKERRSYLKEMIGVMYDTGKLGGVFPFVDQLREAVAGDDELEEEFRQVEAMAGAFELQQGASGSFGDQKAILSAVSAVPVTNRRGVQFFNDFTSAAEKDLNALGADLRKDVEAQIDALKKGVRRGDYDAVMARVSSQDPDLARELGSYETLWAQTRYHEVATAAEIFPRTEAGGMPAPTNEAGVLGYLRAQTVHDKASEQERTDPLATLAAQAVLSPFDVTDPHMVATRALEAQAFFSARLGPDKRGSPRDLVLTTKDEQARERERIANLSTPQQVEAWRNAAHAAGPYGATLLRELDAPGALIWNAEAEKAGAPVGLLAEAARGVSALAGPPANAPKAPAYEDQRKWTYEVVGDLFSRTPSEQARLLEATTAIYAARAGLKQEPDEGLWKASLQAALGANGERGGVHQVAGRLIPLPPSLSAREAEAALEGLRRRHSEAIYGKREIGPPRPTIGADGSVVYGGLAATIIETPPRPMSSVWGGITSTGAAPVIHGQPVDDSVMDAVSLRAVRGGYALEYERRGEFYRLEDPATGAPITLRLEDLARRQ